MLLDNPKKGKSDKVPVNPNSLWGARANDPETWGTCREAAAQIGKTGRCKRPNPANPKEKITATGNIAGVGFMFNGGGIMGVDFDHCIDDQTGEIDPWAASWVERFGQLYRDISQRDGTAYSLQGESAGKGGQAAPGGNVRQGTVFHGNRADIRGLQGHPARAGGGECPVCGTDRQEGKSPAPRLHRGRGRRSIWETVNCWTRSNAPNTAGNSPRCGREISAATAPKAKRI